MIKRSQFGLDMLAHKSPNRAGAYAANIIAGEPYVAARANKGSKLGTLGSATLVGGATGLAGSGIGALMAIVVARALKLKDASRLRNWSAGIGGVLGSGEGTYQQAKHVWRKGHPFQTMIDN